ncbi:MAG: PIN domain-containing protein [Spirochaetales bacterium]|nr:PIN domain-containing protein [Spirochaetales bacterium]
MKKIRLYLDNCCFNRPYDHQSYELIRLEIEAKLHIQDRIRNNALELVWSFILDFENSENPYEDQKEAIYEWKSIASLYIQPTEDIREKANELSMKNNIKSKDALHLACAIEAHCHFLLTTDKHMIKKAVDVPEVKVINPLDFLLIVEAR